jgi:hypothetical protein
MGHQDFSLHANVNKYGGDSVLRLTLTPVTEDGFDQEPSTWRNHASVPVFDRPIDQAYAALVAMVRVLENAGANGRMTVVYQEPLPWSEF